jgi:hopanoid biosynthesis associated protein HpnK
VGPGERSLKRLIVTADDFGASMAVNEAVEIAWRDGILTATSLMAGAPAADDAVRRAKSMEGLGIGLHVVVVRGQSVLSPDEIGAIVDRNGHFDRNLVRAGFRYFFCPAARRALRAEIRAQFEAFAATGLALDHVNAHNHMHLHPTVLSLILDIGRDFGLRAVRLPYDGRSILLRPWLWLLKRRLRRAGIVHNDRLAGLAETGSMDRHSMIAILESLPDGTTEIMTHPATGDWEGREDDAEGYRFADELAALTDNVVVAAADASGARRCAFTGIA